MLIKRTPWLHNSGFCYTKRTVFLSVCKHGLWKVFEPPLNVSRVRFCVYDKPAKYRVKCKLTRDGNIWVCGNRKQLQMPEYYHVSLNGYLSERAIKQFVARQKYYYVECEYESYRDISC